VTAALWIAWCHPIEALARIAAPDVAARIVGSAADASWLGEAFVADVVAAARIAGVLVATLVAWGTYVRRHQWRRGSGPGSGLDSLTVRAGTPDCSEVKA
jgi:hypothetical protein